MRTGADYRQSLRDGRKVGSWVVRMIDDVATHPHQRHGRIVAWYIVISIPPGTNCCAA